MERLKVRSSLLDRVLGTVLVIVVSAWALSWAVHALIGVAPVLIGIGVVLAGGIVGWRYYRDRRSGW